MPRAAFVAAWLGAPWQQRRGCVEDGRLRAAADWHAADLAAREAQGEDVPHKHIDSLGRNANERVRAFGYPLPGEYVDGENYVESVAVAQFEPAVVVEMLYASPSHTQHMAGSIAFFRGQTAYAVGYCAPAWWVVVSAPAALTGMTLSAGGSVVLTGQADVNLASATLTATGVEVVIQQIVLGTVYGVGRAGAVQGAARRGTIRG